MSEPDPIGKDYFTDGTTLEEARELLRRAKHGDEREILNCGFTHGSVNRTTLASRLLRAIEQQEKP